MTALKIMAAALDAELQDRGIFEVSRADCEAIIAAVLERTAKIAETSKKPEPASR
jgi:hypothetical protein